MDKILIRNGSPADGKDFARLFMFTGQELYRALFGKDAENFLEFMFRHRGNYFSFEHAYFLEVNGEVAGMTLLYDWRQKRQEMFRFGILLLRYFKFRFLRVLVPLLKLDRALTGILEGELHSSNSALYPEFRGRHLGEKLFGYAEDKARNEGCLKVTVNVKEDNHTALSLRKKLGYKTEKRLPEFRIGGKSFVYIRLVKHIT